MYKITKISKILDDNLFDTNISLSQKDILINHHNLLPCGKIKEYWINNVNIISNGSSFSFHYIVNNYSDYDNKSNLLIEKYEKTICNPFNFYDSDSEEEYELYINDKNNYTIRMRVYQDSLVLEVLGESLSEIKNNII